MSLRKPKFLRSYKDFQNTKKIETRPNKYFTQEKGNRKEKSQTQPQFPIYFGFIVLFLYSFAFQVLGCRHGVRQLRTGWSDGPAYITQCPIPTGQSYIYNFTLTGQRGTLLWHAHILWLRATLHGAIVILPKHGVPYPFPIPDYEEVIILGVQRVEISFP